MLNPKLEYFHKLSNNNGLYFKKMPDALVGCFFCLETYRADKVKEYAYGRKNILEHTAICKCGIDSVILLPYDNEEENKQLLRGMKNYWFGELND